MRDAILEKAEQQLMSGGFDKLNFAKIAKELDTTRANLHYHFKNKESLAIEVTRQYGARYCDQFAVMRESFKGNFVGFFEAVDGFFWEQPDGDDNAKVNACICLVSDPELPEVIGNISRGHYQNIQQTIKGVIEDAIDNKEIKADVDAQREAIRAHVIMMGIGTSGQHLLNIKQAKEQLGGLLVDWANSLK